MSDIELDAAKLIKARINAGLNQTELARKAGLAQAHVWRMERGERAKCNVETVGRLARALDVPMDALLKGSAARPEPVQPAWSYLDLLKRAEMVAPVPVPIVESILKVGEEGALPLDYVYVPKEIAQNKRLVATQVKGDCMAPTIHEDDVIVIDKEGSPNVGDVVIARKENDELLLRRLKGKTDGYMLLACDNAAYGWDTMRDSQIAGVVIWLGRRLSGSYPQRESSATLHLMVPGAPEADEGAPHGDADDDTGTRSASVRARYYDNGLYQTDGRGVAPSAVDYDVFLA